jgi:hypothetical protein
MAATDTVVVIHRWAPIDRAVHRLSHALGAHSWGYLENVAAGRGTWRREQLTLFPPEISLSERRAFAVYRHGPVAGACLAMCAMIVLGASVPPAQAFFLAFGLYAVVIFASVRATARLRRDSIRLSVLMIVVGDRAESFGNVTTLDETRQALLRLDSLESSGRLSSAEHDLACASLFWALDAERSLLIAERDDGVAQYEGGSSGSYR